MQNYHHIHTTNDDDDDSNTTTITNNLTVDIYCYSVNSDTQIVRSQVQLAFTVQNTQHCMCEVMVKSNTPWTVKRVAAYAVPTVQFER